jgi:hypothetical protein
LRVHNNLTGVVVARGGGGRADPAFLHRREPTGGASSVSSLHPRTTAHAGAALPLALVDALH